MTYEATLRLAKADLDYYDLILDGKGNWEEDWYEDRVESYTVKFENGYEADLKVVGCQEDSPYAECVLFDAEGYEAGLSDPEFEFSGDWDVYDYDGNQYIVHVIAR